MYFVNNYMKPYTWKEIRRVLEKELKKTRHIMTYGTIGSCNIEKDIDTIVTKKPGSKSEDFFKELHELFDKIDNYLQTNYDCKLVRTSRLNDQEEIKYLGNFEKNDLDFQVMSYVSYRQIYMHWYNNLESMKELDDILKSYNCIHGNKQDVFREDFKQYKREDIFITLNDADRINSHVPSELINKRMQQLIVFLVEKKLGKNTNKFKNVKNPREIFYLICKEIDNC